MTDVTSPPVERDQQAPIDLVDPELYATGDPYSIWRQLRQHDPVSWHQPTRGLPGFWVLTKYRDVTAVLADAETFSSAQGILLRPVGHGADPGGGQTLALTDPPRHRELRSLVAEWFSERSVRALRPRITQITAELLDQAAARESVDFVDDVAAKLPLYVICHLFGIPDEDREHVFAMTSKAFASDDPNVQRFSHIELMDYLGRLADRRRKEPRDDIITALATKRIDGKRLSESEFLLNCDNVFIGGTENVRIAASGGLLEFIRRPDQWQALVAECGQLRGAVEEVLRWTSTPTHLMRTARARTEIGNRVIEAGDYVTLWLPSANRDEELFDQPEVFDITRSPNRHLALGTGEHFCLGATLARAELQALYGEMAARFTSIEAGGEPVMLSSIVVNGPKSLPVRLVSDRQS